jgi:hypothetical protein
MAGPPGKPDAADGIREWLLLAGVSLIAAHARAQIVARPGLVLAATARGDFAEVTRVPQITVYGGELGVGAGCEQSGGVDDAGQRRRRHAGPAHFDPVKSAIGVKRRYAGARVGIEGEVRGAAAGANHALHGILVAGAGLELALAPATAAPRGLRGWSFSC